MYKRRSMHGRGRAESEPRTDRGLVVSRGSPHDRALLGAGSDPHVRR